MIDNITIFLEKIKTKKIKKIFTKSKNSKIIQSKKGNKYLQGKFDDIIIKTPIVNNKLINCMFIYGSLHKYYFKENYCNFGRKETEQAINKLEEALNINIKKGKIFKLELGINLIMKYPTEKYFNLLLSMPYLHRTQYKNGLYFHNKRRTIVFYDKIADLKRCKIRMPLYLKNANMLRYEIRLNSKVRKQLKMKTPVNVSMLYEENFYIRLCNLLLWNFQEIKKINIDNGGIEMNNLKDIKANLMTLGLLHIGVSKVFKTIDENETLSKQKKYKLRRFLTDLISNSNKEDNELMKELEERILESLIHYR